MKNPAYEEACVSVADQIRRTTNVTEDNAVPMAMGFVTGLLQELRISSGMDPLDEPHDDAFWRQSWDEAIKYERANGIAPQ